ncbi:hypothetical protein RFI_11479, partial [Reticulomyxa filosa]
AKTQASLNTKQSKLTITLGDSTQTAGYSASNGNNTTPVSTTTLALIICGVLLGCCVVVSCCFYFSRRNRNNKTHLNHPKQVQLGNHIEQQEGNEGQAESPTIVTTQMKTNTNNRKVPSRPVPYSQSPETAGDYYNNNNNNKDNDNRQRFGSSPNSEDSSKEDSMYKKPSSLPEQETRHTFGLKVDEEQAAPVKASPPPPPPPRVYGL